MQLRANFFSHLLFVSLLCSCKLDRNTESFPAHLVTTATELGASHLIVGGTVVTMNGAMDIVKDGAVAVNNGVLVYVGRQSDLPVELKDLPRFDATGKLIIPGLINTHTHVPMTLFRGLADDLPLMTWLEQYIFPAERKNVTEDFVRWGTRLALAEMIQGGTTTFADMYYFESAIADETQKAGLRAVLGQTVIDFPTPDNKTWEDGLAAVNAFATKYADHPLITPAIAPHAPYTLSKEHMIAAHALAKELGLPLLIHLSETRTENDTTTREHGATAVAYLNNLGVLDNRMVATHVVWPSPEEISMLANAKVGVAHCPQSNMKLASGVAPVPDMRAAGIPVGLGTDGAASNNDLDMWGVMNTAAKLQKVHRLDPTLITAAEAFRMATIEGARALHLDQKIGSLEVGKRADLVIVNIDAPHALPLYDVYSQLVYALKASDVESVMVEGRWVMKARALVTLDLPTIRKKAATYRESILASFDKPAK